MSMPEANAIIDSIANVEKESWEKVRWSAYIQALSAGSKIKKPSDLIKFGWELSEAEIIGNVNQERTREQKQQDIQWMLDKVNAADGSIFGFENFEIDNKEIRD